MKIDRGDVVWADMAPTVGREQRGHRPYLVLSDDRFHSRRQVVIAVPMTTTHKPWPTRVPVGTGSWAIAEQPTTVSVQRITKVEATGHDVTAVRDLVVYLMGGPQPAP
ncbi:MAG: type II toxin-antitoxin system PemK/MazF family toxin [Micrococcales bacterium]|nr:type II toxin-antitoxin system PemK/MazF family toxin [Micrococcales bacterium]